jgi:hypothetical protein
VWIRFLTNSRSQSRTATNRPLQWQKVSAWNTGLSYVLQSDLWTKGTNQLHQMQIISGVHYLIRRDMVNVLLPCYARRAAIIYVSSAKRIVRESINNNVFFFLQ